jgi:hypothetical protein
VSETDSESNTFAAVVVVAANPDDALIISIIPIMQVAKIILFFVKITKSVYLTHFQLTS